jgi:hypothetical protein
MIRLSSELQRYTIIANDSEERRLQLFARLPDYVHADKASRVSESDLVLLFAMADRLENIRRLSIAIVQFATGQALTVSVSSLLPPSPLIRDVVVMRETEVDYEAMEAWIRGGASWDLAF